MRKSLVVAIVVTAASSVVGVAAPANAVWQRSTLVSSGGRWDAYDISVDNRARVVGYVHVDDRGSFVAMTDTTTHKSQRISPIAGNTEDDDVWNVQVSGNGAVIWFGSNHPGVVTGVDDHKWHMYRFVRKTGGTTIVAESDGTAPVTPSTLGCNAVSADGRYLVVRTPDALADSDHNGVADYYLYDAVTNNFQLISHTATGNAAGATAACASISADGTQVVYISTRNGIVPSDRDNKADAFVWHKSADRNTLVTTGSLVPVGAPTLSGSGATVAFFTRGSVGSKRDVYQVRVTSPHPRRLIHNLYDDGFGNDLLQSSDGRYIFYQQYAVDRVTFGAPAISTVIGRLDTKTGGRVIISRPQDRAIQVWAQPNGHAAAYMGRDRIGMLRA